MSTLIRLLSIGSLVVLLGACGQTHYVNGNLSLRAATNPTPTPEPVSGTPAVQGTTYVLANINDGQVITNVNNALGNFLKFPNEQADPLKELNNGVWVPTYPGYYQISVSVTFPAPPSSGAGTSFQPAGWPTGSSCSVQILRGDGVPLTATVMPAVGTSMCQAQANFSIAMRKYDALTFYAQVSVAQSTTVSRAQLGMTGGYNPWNVLAISFLHQ